MKNRFFNFKRLSYIAVALLYIGCKTPFPENYQVRCNSTISDATYTVAIIYQANNVNADLERIKLSALDGILFRGLTSANGCTTQKPMVIKQKSELKGTSFFKQVYGKKQGYQKYVTNIEKVSQENIPTGTKKQQYSFTYHITINKELLRKDLIEAGITKPLNAGF